MEVVLVAALSRNRVIGRDGQLPWRLPADLRHFKELTLDRPIVMGRKTFESIGRPLPRRKSIVLSRTLTSLEGCELVGTVEAAVLAAEPASALYVVGGGDIYALFLPRATRLELTHIDADVEGDVLFPEVDPRAWRLVREELHPSDARHAHWFRFSTYVRRPEPAPSPGELAFRG